ncbi:uncharacterized protein LOC132723281, partial [Ruditapes philippinarum]|uniref:uncharacterized protein LOC132723281 n=1 Tax=Ruditapes philippinarum TaxID=129788 RepID=UPI00295B9907
LTCLLPSIKNALYNGYTAGRLVNVGTNVLVTCTNGYEFATDSPQSVTCNNDRTLSALPQCVDKEECTDTNICGFKCHNTDGSYYCSCDAGYTLSMFDRRSCNDINECTSNHNCDGTCINEQGSYRCECSAPYVLYTADLVSNYAIPREAGERGDLPTDTYHIGHSCVLLSCDTPVQNIENGKILTKREYHRYGEHVEYNCDIGFTPRRIIRFCGFDGQWTGTEPVCQAASCAETVPNVLQTRPVVESGPYNYGQRLTLQCTVGDNTFDKYRFCTYNPNTDDYEMQGSQYECGVIDCGLPKLAPGSSYALPSVTTLGSSFDFTCQTDTREGLTQAGHASLVYCLKEGYWDFGNLQCTEEKCLDPTYPPDGDIIADSFADRSTVSFKCLRQGYSLSNDVTLTCNRDNFFSNNEQVPTCRDTEKPVINNCPTTPISIRKYEALPPRLPQLTVTDNTAVRSFTITPSNANTTYFVSNNLQVVYTATDFAGNVETCTVNVEVTDEEPPLINCPADRVVYMDTDNEEKEYDKLRIEDVVPQNQRAEIKSFFVTGEPDILRTNDLYRTYTFTIQVEDQAGNQASCRQQIFVQPRPCSEISYPTPLNAKKECTFSGTTRTCVLTCDDLYTFEDGKTKTVQCSSGSWGNTPWIPACVRDVTPPVVSCPSSSTISNLDQRGETFEFDFATNLGNSVGVNDLNTYGNAQFIPEKYTFTETDLYRPKVVIVQVTDTAGNTGSCSFEYTAVPPVCSELSLLAPIDGGVSGTRRAATSTRSAGWDVTITCNTGKILRNVGASTTVSCNDGQSWSNSDIFPICIDDNAGPTLACPTSAYERITTGDDERRIDFANVARYAGTATDLSGIASRSYQPAFIDVNFNALNTVRQISLTVTDNAGNPSVCSFQVAIIAEECSPLALPTPANGAKYCTETLNGWSCELSCNPNYSFYSTTQNTIRSSCTNGGEFGTYIPDCARDDDTTNKQFIGKMRYEYVPESTSITSIPQSCITGYKTTLSAGAPSILDRMTTRLKNSCDNNYGPFNADFVLSFLPDSTDVTIQTNGRTVEMIFSYTIVYSDTTIYEKCATSFLNDIGGIGNIYPLSGNIPASGNCPELKWDQVAEGAGRGLSCAAPFFASLTNNEQCVRCPAGTQSNGEFCSICPKGTYRNSADASCIQCPTSYTTRYPGATNSGSCIAPCTGSISTTGFSPCLTCQKGSYRSDSLTCQSCGFGQTTNGDGATSPDACVSSTIDD